VRKRNLVPGRGKRIFSFPKQPDQLCLLFSGYRRLSLVIKRVGMKLTTHPGLALTASVLVLDNLTVVL